jgi:hypothetical protein
VYSVKRERERERDRSKGLVFKNIEIKKNNKDVILIK